MKRSLRRRASRAVVYALPLVLLGASNCEFDPAGQPGGLPSLGTGKPCMVAATKFPLFDPGLGTEGSAIPGDVPLERQCLDRAREIQFQWTLERQSGTGDVEEIGSFSEVDTVDLVPLEEGEPAHCTATAHIGASVFFDILPEGTDILDPDFSFGMFRAAHSAPGWNETCEFVEVTTCPHPLGPEVIPIWASHATRDVDGCEQGTAFVPIGVGPVEDDVPFPEP